MVCALVFGVVLCGWMPCWLVGLVVAARVQYRTTPYRTVQCLACWLGEWDKGVIGWDRVIWGASWLAGSSTSNAIVQVVQYCTTLALAIASQTAQASTVLTNEKY
ncbi:hypothetical protein L873DRAFT_1847297 [Choiromyces venosus 120613-1]|uniref:Uncharacterized protein n=1 Tax=Choiromyces venosus 120613-1 TaxID=1336337 RepID=A0A3N4JHJ4_9PEZI|nr:hypothetical protein L873DRAFT_1847297 [Choiromyces venosus 120613-1]